jgi:hypothetical protein
VRFRNRRLLSLLLVAFASVAALALSACGGGGNSGDAKQTLADAFKHPVKSGNLSLDISAKVEGVPQLTQPVALKLSGPFESQGANKLPKLDWDVNVSGSGQTFTGKLVSTGDNAFIGFQGQNYEVGTQAVQQFEQQAAKQGGQKGLTPKQLGIDPASWLKDPKNAGDEDVAGTKTSKITGGIDVGKLLTDLNGAVDKAGGAMGATAPSKITPEQIAQVKQVVKDPTFEAFVAKDDKTLRRLTTTINFTIPAAQRSQANGATGGTITFTLQFANVGQPAQVTAPTGAKPLSDLQQQLQGGLGGIGGSGSGSSGSSGSGSGSSGSGSGGTTPSQKKFEDYAKCLQQANGNAAKVQECSKILQ